MPFELREGWNLIRNHEEFNAYFKAFLAEAIKQKGDEALKLNQMTIDQFPLMIISTVVGNDVLSAFFLVATAKELLDAAKAEPAIAVTQDAFNRDMVAQHMALIDIMVEAGLLKKEVYERKLVAFRALVDQARTAQVDQRKKITGSLDASVARTIDQLPEIQ